MKWMESNKGPDMGWAVGRRIYEKEEIEVKIFVFTLRSPLEEQFVLSKQGGIFIKNQ